MSRRGRPALWSYWAAELGAAELRCYRTEEVRPAVKPDLLDLILLVAMLCYAVGGFRNGAVLGGLSFTGFFGGAALGAQLAKPLGRMLANGAAQVPVAIVCVLFFAVFGQLIAIWAGGRLRSKVTWRPARRLDRVIGSLFSALAVLLVAWMVALPLAFAPFPALSDQVRRSVTIRAVDDALPDSVRNLYGSLRRFIDAAAFRRSSAPCSRPG